MSHCNDLRWKRLWQIGKADAWKNHLTNDVAFQIHDIDNDGKNEVIYTMNMEIIVADAATGKTKYKTRTPLVSPSKEVTSPERFPRILGDSPVPAILKEKAMTAISLLRIGMSTSGR